MATVALGSRKGKWIMVSAILASSMAFIDSTALNVVLPSLQKSLHATGSDLFWILNAYLLMLASLILIGGAIGDRLGRKKVFMVGIFIFITGSAACGFAPMFQLSDHIPDDPGDRRRPDDPRQPVTYILLHK